MVRRFRAHRSSVNYKRSIRRWLPVERTIKVVRANLIWRGRTSARKLRVPSCDMYARTTPTEADSLSLSLSFILFEIVHDRFTLYLELYMPQFQICVKQCAKLPAYMANRTVSRSNKLNKIQTRLSVNYRTGEPQVNLSQNILSSLLLN